MTVARRGRGGGCALCGAAGAACGHPSASVPVDLFQEVAVVGGTLNLYEVTMPSGVVATLKLNTADAERLGGIPVVGDREAVTPEAPPTKARAPRDKRRTPAARNKKEGGGGG